MLVRSDSPKHPIRNRYLDHPLIRRRAAYRIVCQSVPLYATPAAGMRSSADSENNKVPAARSIQGLPGVAKRVSLGQAVAGESHALRAVRAHIRYALHTECQGVCSYSMCSSVASVAIFARMLGCAASVGSRSIRVRASVRAASTSLIFLSASMPMSERPDCRKP